MSGALETPQSRRPSALVLGAVLCAILLFWCFNYVAGKIALRHMDPFTLVSLRIETAALVSLAMLYARPRAKRFQRRDVWTFASLGFFGVVLNQGGYILGLNYTTSERSVLLVTIAPIVVSILARGMGLETITTGKAVGLCVASIGVGLLESERGTMGNTPLAVGDFFTLVGVIGFSVFSVLGKRLVDPRKAQGGTYDALSFNTFTLIAAAIELLPAAIRQSLRLSWATVGWQGWGGLLYMSIFSSIFSYTLFYWILQFMDASRVAAINYVQPFVVIALSMTFLGERPTGHLLLAAVLVLAGVYLVEKRGSAGHSTEKVSTSTT